LKILQFFDTFFHLLLENLPGQTWKMGLHRGFAHSKDFFY